MRIQFTISILVVAVLVMAIFSSHELTQRHLKEAHHQLENSTERGVNQLVYMLSQRVKEAHSELNFLFQHRNSQFQGEPSFQYIVELTASPESASGETQNTFQVAWKRFFNLSLKSWSDQEILSALHSLSLNEVTSDSLYFGKVHSKYSKPYIATLVQSGTSIYMGLLPIYFFSGIDENYKGGGKEQAIVVDDQGSALVYPERKFLSSKVAGHSIVKSILSEKKVRSSGEYINFNGKKLVGSYRRVEGSNLFGAITQELPVASGLWWKPESLALFIVALAIILMAASLIYSLSKPMLKKYEYLLLGVNSLSNGFPIQGLAGKNKFLSTLEKLLLSVQNRMDGLEESSTREAPLPDIESSIKGSASGNKEDKKPSLNENDSNLSKLSTKDAEEVVTLAQSCQGTLSVILGHIQMASEKTSSEALVDHLKIVENESRQLQSMNERLLKMIGPPTHVTTEVDLRETLLKILNIQKKDIESHKIKISKTVGGPIPLNVAQDQLSDLLRRLIKHAVDSMKDSLDKELSLELCSEGGTAHLIVKSTGKAISQATLEQVSTPLASPIDNHEVIAEIGVTIISGLARSLGGEIQIESKPGIGNTFFIAFPTATGEKEDPLLAQDALLNSAQQEEQLKSSEIEEDGAEEALISIGGKASLDDSELEGLSLPSSPPQKDNLLELQIKSDLESELSQQPSLNGQIGQSEKSDEEDNKATSQNIEEEVLGPIEVDLEETAITSVQETQEAESLANLNWTELLTNTNGEEALTNEEEALNLNEEEVFTNLNENENHPKEENDGDLIDDSSAITMVSLKDIEATMEASVSGLKPSEFPQPNPDEDESEEDLLIQQGIELLVSEPPQAESLESLMPEPPVSEPALPESLMPEPPPESEFTLLESLMPEPPVSESALPESLMPKPPPASEFTLLESLMPEPPVSEPALPESLMPDPARACSPRICQYQSSLC